MTNGYFVPKRLLDAPLARAAYSDRTAWVLVQMAELGYGNFETPTGLKALKADLANGGFILVDIFVSSSGKDTGTEAFLAHRDNKFWVLSFRGTTANAKDIFTDLNARFLDTPEGRAHKGFLMAYRSVEEKIKKAIKKIPSGASFYITGHSLGGALATVATMQLENVFPVSACYTFGSPRVGTEEWVTEIKAPIYRVVNSSDGVPLLPFSSFMTAIPVVKHLVKLIGKFGFFGFQHVGSFKYINSEKNLKIGSAATIARLKQIGVNFFTGIFSRDIAKFRFFFRDHRIKLYQDGLKNWAEKRNPKP